jgi:hypothetical protein
MAAPRGLESPTCGLENRKFKDVPGTSGSRGRRVKRVVRWVHGGATCKGLYSEMAVCPDRWTDKQSYSKLDSLWTKGSVFCVQSCPWGLGGLGALVGEGAAGHAPKNL